MGYRMVQWNCRRLTPNYKELLMPLTTLDPTVTFNQETF